MKLCTWREKEMACEESGEKPSGNQNKPPMWCFDGVEGRHAEKACQGRRTANS